MPDDSLAALVAEAVERHRPDAPPPFGSLTARFHRRRRVRLGAAAAAVVVAAAVAVPLALGGGRSEAPDPEVAASASRPVGRVPAEVTGVSACRGTDCRRVDDPAQVRLLVDDFNAADLRLVDHPGPCEPDPVGVTLTFSGPRGPYPVLRVMTSCSWWSVEGETQKYTSGRAEESAAQAQRPGLVVHDCGVTSSHQRPDDSAPAYVGLTLAEARSLAAGTGAAVRVLGEDRDCFDRTLDYRGPARVNLYLENGRVASAAFG